MKQLMETVYRDVEKCFQSKEDKLIIRVDGFENLSLYQLLCEQVAALCQQQNRQLIAKIALRKFEQLSAEPEYASSAAIIRENGWLDEDNAMTSYRNRVPEAGERLVILMLGTDMVDDKGGLTDFYSITPNRIDKEIGDHYSHLMGSTLRSVLEDEQVDSVVDKFFGELFSCVPKDLSSVSDILDKWVNDPPTAKEAMQILFESLPRWGLPKIVDAIEELPVTKYLAQKKDSLLLKANQFITGKMHAHANSTLPGNISKKFAKYSEELRKYAVEYPAGQDIGSLEVLEPIVIDFVMGNRSDRLRQRLIHTDYSIIEDVLQMSLGPRRRREGPVRITGMPLKVISQAVLELLQRQSTGADEICVVWESVNICGVPSNVEVSGQEERQDLLRDAYLPIAAFAGGVVDYMAGETWMNAEGESISLTEESKGFLCPENAAHLLEEGKLSTCSGASHYIMFRVEARSGDAIVGKEEYKWVIDPMEDWVVAFREFFTMPDTDCYIPASTAKELNAAFALKDAEAFAWWITHEEIVHLSDDDDLYDYLKDYLMQRNELAWASPIFRLGKAFQSFRGEVVSKGFYTAIDASLNRFIDEYVSLAERMTDVDNPIFANKLYSMATNFLRWFTVCESKELFFENVKLTQVLVPPWHPATLEKIADQMLFIRTGLREWNDFLGDKSDVISCLMQLISLSAISTSTDGFIGMGSKVLTLSATNGYYTLYGGIREDGSFTRAQTIERKETVFSDDFEDLELKIMTREAEVLVNVMKQYTETYPSTKCRLSLAFVNPDDLQMIVAALSKYVERVHKDNGSVSVELTVLLRNDSHGARTYLAYWINHAFSQDDDVDIKAYLRVYTSENEIPKLMSPTTDLTFFFDAMNTAQNADYNFMPTTTAEHMLDCRFPMVFKPTLKTKYNTQHAIEITQTQFRAALQHTQVMVLAAQQLQPSRKMALQQQSTTDDRRGKVIAKVQEKTIWLCCIDNAMDKYTVRKLYADQSGIIGFTTGEGSSGQMNLAITCRKDLISDITRRCRKRLHRMFPSWSDDKLNRSAQFCIRKAGEMDGVSILRAMNPNDYDMNNFMAYLIADELIERREDCLSVLIRLDSYRHWFNDEKNVEKKIPDFLLIEAPICENEPLHITATVIEAKLAGYTSMMTEHLPKAREQVQKGRKVLERHFDPHSRSVERRYWLAQLYRAIAFLQTDVEFSNTAFEMLKKQMDALMDGNFVIEWHERILACEIDCNTVMTKSADMDSEGMPIELWEIGQLAIQNLLLANPVETPMSYDNDATVETPSADDSDEDTSEDEIIFDDDTVSNPVLTVNSKPILDSGSVPAVASDVNPPSDTVSPPASQPPLSNRPVSDSESCADLLPLEQIRVLIGKDKGGREVCWEFGHPQLSNRHLLITGTSGQGKTYAIQTFLYELARQGISSVVFDYTDGFLPGKLEKPFEKGMGNKLEQHYAILGKLPINPFKQQTISIPNTPIVQKEQSTFAAGRFAAIMKHVYGFGEQQYSALYTACRAGIDHFGEAMDFKKLQDQLMSMNTTYSRTVLSKMQQLFDLDLFDTTSALDWSSMTERDGKVTVIQLTNLDREIQTVITEMLMWDAWYSLVKCGDKSRPFVVVLDEAQNLSIADGSPAQKILQEGRKYGWSAWFATQFMRGALDSDEISRLQQAAEVLYFKPSGEEASSVASGLADENTSASTWTQTLKNMQKGTCIVRGDRIRPNGTFGASTPTLVKVSSFEERN